MMTTSKTPWRRGRVVTIEGGVYKDGPKDYPQLFWPTGGQRLQLIISHENAPVALVWFDEDDPEAEADVVAILAAGQAVELAENLANTATASAEFHHELEAVKGELELVVFQRDRLQAQLGESRRAIGQLFGGIETAVVDYIGKTVARLGNRPLGGCDNCGEIFVLPPDTAKMNCAICGHGTVSQGAVTGA